MVRHNLKLQEIDLEHKKACKRKYLKTENKDYISEMRANRTQKLRNETEGQAFARIL